MSLRNEQTSKPCPCGRGKIMTGRWQKYNGKVDGKDACHECVIDAAYGRFRNENSSSG